MNQLELTQMINASGIRKGDCVLLHSSLSSLGYMEGGASSVVTSLIESVGETGTAIFPAFTFSSTYNNENPPVFDVRTSPCVKAIGVIPEAARVYPGGIRSNHPTHSVTAFGKLAEWIAEGHEYAPGPCGTRTPFDKLATIGGKILMLGALLQSNTSIHHAEELASCPFVLQKAPMDITITDKNTERITLSNTRLHNSGAARNYNRFDEILIAEDIMVCVQIGPATARIIDACKMRRYFVNLLLKDPLATLDESAKSDWLE